MFPANRLLVTGAVILVLSFPSSSVLGRADKPGSKGDVDPKTGLRFVLRAGAFQRQKGIEYDSAGYPEATYFAGALGYASVFYYKNLPFAAEYANARDAVRQKKPAAKLISDGASSLHPRGRRSVFTFDDMIGGRTTKMLSELLMFPRGDYYLTFRITYIASHANRMRQEIDTLVKAFKL